MKKKYLAYAGIAAAAILVVMFIGILSTGSFAIVPTASIDSIPDHTSGDLVTITGTTTYPAGTRLTLDVLAVSPKTGHQARAGATDAFIVRGPGMTNTWSGALDTTGILPGEYLVNAYWVDESNATDHKRSSLLASSQLILNNGSTEPTKLAQPLMNHTLSFIDIDKPGTISRGDKILISGTTNLPEDTGLLYLVIQQSNKSVFTVDPKTGKQDLRGGFTRSGLIDVMPGENGVNRWSFSFDSTEAIPDQYEVIVTLPEIGVANIGREGPYGSEPLVILESTSDSLTPVAKDTGPCQSITIDPVPGSLARRNYTITGTTRLQPGTELLFRVLPAEFGISVDQEGMASGTMSGALGSATVVAGSGGINTWSADLDLTTFPPEKYMINVSNDRIDPRTYETISGDRYCSTKFTLSGGVP